MSADVQQVGSVPQVSISQVWVPIIVKASQVESYCNVDICEEGANIRRHLWR